MSEKPAKERIIHAVVECIEQFGIENTTTRKIANQAKVNVASINYYFRSKDELIDAAMTMTISHMVEDVIRIAGDGTIEIERVVEEVFFYLIDGTIRFPGISAAHLYAAVTERRYEAPGTAGIRRAFDAVETRLSETLTGRDRGKVRFALSRLFYALFIEMLAPGFLETDSRFRASTSDEARPLAREYADLFFRSIS